MPGFDDALRGNAFPVHQRDGFRCRYCGLDGIPASFAELAVVVVGPPASEWAPEPRQPRLHRDGGACSATRPTIATSTWPRSGGRASDELTPDELVAQRVTDVAATRAKYDKF